MRSLLSALLFLLLILSGTAYAQTVPAISIEAGKMLTGQNVQAAINFGIVNWRNERASIGAVVKNYDGHNILGGRLNGLFYLGGIVRGFTQGDVFYEPDPPSEMNQLRLELSWGAGVVIGDAFIGGAIQFSDYNPVTRIERQFVPSVKVAYNIKLK